MLASRHPTECLRGACGDVQLCGTPLNSRCFVAAAVVCLQYKTAVTPWVGLRKINVSYWCWEDMSPFTNTSLQWLPGEPSDAGFCGYLAEPASSSLKAQSCINPVNGSLCERPGGACAAVFLLPEEGLCWFSPVNAVCSSANHSAKPCRTPCAMRSTCSECTSTSSECMWCSNMKQCVDSNAYVASFPFGQCMEWYTMNSCPRKSCSSSPPAAPAAFAFTHTGPRLRPCTRAALFRRGSARSHVHVSVRATQTSARTSRTRVSVSVDSCCGKT